MALTKNVKDRVRNYTDRTVVTTKPSITKSVTGTDKNYVAGEAVRGGIKVRNVTQPAKNTKPAKKVDVSGAVTGAGSSDVGRPTDSTTSTTKKTTTTTKSTKTTTPTTTKKTSSGLLPDETKLKGGTTTDKNQTMSGTTKPGTIGTGTTTASTPAISGAQVNASPTTTSNTAAKIYEAIKATPVNGEINVPLEQAELREVTPVERYDPYADEQYNRQLQEYRDSIAGAYERQRQESDIAYAANKSAADRQALSRGMQRSSYNNQVLANIDTAAAKARQEISDREEEAAQQFGVQLASELRSQNQYEQQMNYQRERDAMSDYFTQSQLNLQRQQNAIQNQQADRAFNYQQSRDAVTDAFNNRAFEYQQSRDAVSDALNERNYNYQLSRDAVTDEQWNKTFDQNAKNSSQQIALQVVSTIAQNGGSVTDTLLKQAGLTRKDFNSMKKKDTTKTTGTKNTTTPVWKQKGFKSEAEYNAYLKTVNGSNNKNGTTGSSLDKVNK